MIGTDSNTFAYIIGTDFEADAEESYVEARAAAHLAHVCRYWRLVAFETSLLWTRIDSRFPKLQDMFLERSKDLPVSLYLESSVDNLAESLLSAPEQLRRLDLKLESLEEPLHVFPVTTWLSPKLECLTMVAAKDYYSGTLRRPLARTPLLGGQATALKALALQYLGSWMPSNAFPNLTHLHLSFAFSTDAEAPDFLHVLANAPHLEFVLIGQLLYVPVVDEELPFDSDPVVLSHLRSLTLVTCGYNSSMRLLRHLSLPENCLVRLTDLYLYVAAEGEPPPLADVGALHPPTEMDIATSDDQMLLVVDSDTSGFWIQAHRDDRRSTWDAWLHGLPAMIMLSTITSLHINVDSCTHTFWAPVLQHMLAVIELKAVICEPRLGLPQPMDMFCALLSEEPVLLPSLRDLFMQGVYFYDTTTTLASGKFVEVVANRARTGHRLRRLVVQPDSESQTETCNPFGSRIAELAAHVDAFQLVGFGTSLCKYEMRDVWDADGAEKYWKVHESDRPRYVLPSKLYWM